MVYIQSIIATFLTVKSGAMIIKKEHVNTDIMIYALIPFLYPCGDVSFTLMILRTFLHL